MKMTPENLKQVRKQLGLSQLKLAKLASVSRYRIFLFENEYGSLREEEERKISSLLNLRAKNR